MYSVKCRHLEREVDYREIQISGAEVVADQSAHQLKVIPFCLLRGPVGCQSPAHGEHKVRVDFASAHPSARLLGRSLQTFRRIDL